MRAASMAPPCFRVSVVKNLRARRRKCRISMKMSPAAFKLPIDLAGQTLAAVLRHFCTGLSWSEARRLISSRRVRVNGVVCLDEARRLQPGDRIDITDPASAPPPAAALIVFVDDDLVVVEKPPGMQTVRRPEELDWPAERKHRQPVLQEHIAHLLDAMPASGPRADGARFKKLNFRAVHRLDRDTSGLMYSSPDRPARKRNWFGNSPLTRLERAYLAVVHGTIAGPMRVDSWLVRDRGDGIRGSITDESSRKRREAGHYKHSPDSADRIALYVSRMPARNRPNAPDSHSSCRARPHALRRKSVSVDRAGRSLRRRSKRCSAAGASLDRVAIRSSDYERAAPFSIPAAEGSGAMD